MLNRARRLKVDLASLCFGVLLAALALLAATARAGAEDPSAGDISLAQYLLIWTGDYRGMVDGIAGPQTRAAMLAFFERRLERLPDTATEEQIEALVEEAAANATRFGFVLRRDEELDVTFGLPQALLRPAPGNGNSSRRLFRSADGTVELEVAYLPNRYVSLDQLYRRLTSIRGRTVAYSRFTPSWFVLSGHDGDRSFYVRYHGPGRQIRGFSISYATARASELEPAVIAMSNVFRPTAAAADPLIRFLDGLQSQPARHEVAEIPPGEDTTGSGFVVDAGGHVLTNAHVVTDCAVILVAGNDVARLVASDGANDLALLHSAAAGELPALVVRSDPVRLGEEVVAAGFPLHGVLADSLNVTPGIISSLSGLRNDSRFLQTTASVQPGNSGGPLVDRGATVVGVVAGKLDAVFALEHGGFLPEGVNFAIRHETVRAFLEANRIDFAVGAKPAGARSIEEIAVVIGRSVVPIECRAAR